MSLSKLRKIYITYPNKWGWAANITRDPFTITTLYKIEKPILEKIKKIKIKMRI